MPELIAADFTSGWAYVRHDTELYLVRPPYGSEPPCPVAADAVAKAIAFHGIRPARGGFDGWDSVYAHLRERVAWERGDPPELGDDLRSALIADAPDEILTEYLDGLEGQLSRGDRRAAERLLPLISATGRARENSSVTARCRKLTLALRGRAADMPTRPRDLYSRAAA